MSRHGLSAQKGFYPLIEALQLYQLKWGFLSNTMREQAIWLNVNAQTGVTVRAEGLLCLNDNARPGIPVRAYISRKYRQTHSVTRKGGHCDNDRPKLGITNFGVPVRKRGLTMRAMRLAMRARGLTLRALKFIAKNAHMGSPIARTNVARIMLLTYTSKSRKECMDYRRLAY